MKKAVILCLAALLSMSVCACASAKSASTYTVGEYVVDRENGTISDGTYTYQYTLSGDSAGYSVSITYPDGSTYWWRYQSNSNGTGFGSGGWSDDYDAERYASGDVLCDVLAAGVPRASKANSPGMVLFTIVVLGIGLFNAIFPYTAWYLSSGWKYKDAEPSDTALGLTRAGGIAAIFIAVILFFTS